MNLIQCTEHCIHQKDGYCCLENAVKVSSTGKACCYFKDIRKTPYFKKTAQ